MDPLSSTDQLTSLWRLQSAWRRLHPEAEDTQMPDTLKTAEPASRFAAFLGGLQSLLDVHRAEIAAVPVTEPEPASTDAVKQIDMTQFAGMDGKRNPGKGRLFVDLRRFAEAPEWVQVIPAPSSYYHDWYGEILITAEQNARMVQNFVDDVYGQKLPVDAEHETKLSGAFGWIEELRLNDDDSVSARIEWTPRGILAFERDAFRYVSPEWFDWWEQPMTGETYRNVLIGLALCARPFFKESSLPALFSIVATEAGLTAPDPGDPQVPPTPAAAAPVAVQPESDKGAIQMSQTHEPNVEQPITLTAEQAKQFAELQEQAKQFAELQAQHTALTEKLTAQEAQITQLSEANAAAAREAMIRRFTDEVRGRSEANPNQWAGEIEQHVSVLVAMAEALGEDSAAFQAHVATQRGVAATVKSSNLFSAVGTSQGGEAGTAEEQLAAKARALRASEPTLSEAEAYSRVVTEHPDLHRQYLTESRSGR